MEPHDHRLTLATLAVLRNIRAVEDSLGLIRQAIEVGNEDELRDLKDVGVDTSKDMAYLVAHLGELSLLAEIAGDEAITVGAVEFR